MLSSFPRLRKARSKVAVCISVLCVGSRMTASGSGPFFQGHSGPNLNTRYVSQFKECKFYVYIKGVELKLFLIK